MNPSTVVTKLDIAQRWQKTANPCFAAPPSRSLTTWIWTGTNWGCEGSLSGAFQKPDQWTNCIYMHYCPTESQLTSCPLQTVGPITVEVACSWGLYYQPSQSLLLPKTLSTFEACLALPPEYRIWEANYKLESHTPPGAQHAMKELHSTRLHSSMLRKSNSIAPLVMREVASTAITSSGNRHPRR